ncbi:MAG: GNAT family N-acetyltransferase [Candidatus Thermoplasmatota archaeon]|nr:GNAT family N-acetyltransferase [Candidatus Thermoplasmatota archaeon]MBU1941250.1 GNAT family N-acetyltransferase [Candidatus Thermoplasmatota archaeon]
MQIRRAASSDAKVLASHNVMLAQESENCKIELETTLAGVYSVLADPSKGFYVVALENEKIVGQLMITFEWSDWRNRQIWWVQSVYVKFGFRRKGVFQNMFKYIETEAKTACVSLIRLYVHDTNVNACLVYDALGLQPAPYHMYEFNVQ